MLTRTELVGRESELEALRTVLDDALAGRPRVVLCEGEPGIGKTRLAEELVALASAGGATSAWGVGVDASGPPPYWPWWQILRSIAAKVDLDALARQHLLTADLARVAPDVFGTGESNAASADVDASPADRFRQFDAVARLLRHVSLQVPLAIVLDDAHWADEPSLLLLQHVTRSLTDERLLVVVNSRDTEQRRPLLTGLVREPRARHIALRGLATPDIRRHLTLLTGRDPGERDVGEVEAVTGGNPFFVTEMGRVLVDRDAGRRVTSITPTVRDAIAGRLARLSAECAVLLQAAAVVGREFPVGLVAGMTELSVDRCLRGLDEAIAAGLVEGHNLGPDRRFVHALVRDAIEAGMGTVEQIRLHQRAAEAIEQQDESPHGAVLFELARHWAAAAVSGDGARAAHWLERAGSEAMRQRAYEEAARLFRQAVELGGAALVDTRRCDLLVRAGAAASLAGDFGTCLDACLGAAAVARQLGRPDLVADAALVMDPGGEAGFDIVIRRLCEEAAASLPADATALRARVFAKFAETFIFLAGPDDAGPASEKALELAEESGDARALAAALRARQVVCAGPDGLAERERLAARLLAVSRTTGDPSVEMAAHSWQIDASLGRGELQRVAVEVDALNVCADEVRGPLARFQVLSCRAVLAQAQARYADALRLERDAFAVLLPTRHPAAFHVRAGLSSLIGRHVGQDATLLAGASFADAPPEVRESSGLVATINRAHALVTAGNLAAAAEIYRSLGPVGGWRPPPHVYLFSYAFGITVAVALDARADVAVLRDLLVPYRGQHVASGITAVAYFGPVELWLGVAAHHLRSLDDAVTDLEYAEGACTASGAAGFGVEAKYELAGVLAERSARGDVERARALLAEARTSATALGMTATGLKIETLGARLSAAAGDSPLTRREHEVAELVAAGLTNREIADRLFLSERTAENHVQHILTKLDVSNRSQIAAWASQRRMSTATE